MYQTGDLILYGTLGVCEVADIAVQNLSRAAKEQIYYTIKPLHQTCVIYAPVENSKVFIRPILTKEEAELLIDKIPTIQAKAYHNRVLSQLTEHYEASLQSHDCVDLVELTMSLYAKKQDMEKQKHKFGSVDEKFMKRAEDLLFGELSAALGIQKESVPAYIMSRVDALNQDRRKNCDECNS